MRLLAQIAFFLVLALPSFGQTVGGAGWCKTSVNPNTITSLRVVNQRNMCSNVWDTLARKMYYYDYSLTVGSRWVEFVPLGPPIGAETKVEAGTGIGVSGNGTIATPYIISNTGDLSSTNELQYVDTLLYSGDTLRLSLSLDGRPQKKVYIPQSPGGIYGVSDTTTGNHVATIAADRTLTFRAQDDDAGGIVPFRVTSTGSEPDIMGLYANGDSLVFGKSDTEMTATSSTGLLIAAANTLALQGDSVQVQTLPTAPSTEKTYVVQGTDAYLRTREGIPLDHLTQSGATTGQVVKWSGTAWAADTDGVGDNWGSQTVTTTGSTLSGVGTAGSPLKVATGGIGATEISSLGTAGTYGSATQVPVFTTDADGRVSAVTNTTITGLLPSGTSNQTLRHNGTNWEASSFVANTGTGLTVNNITLDGNNIFLPLTGVVQAARFRANATGSHTLLESQRSGVRDWQIDNVNGDIWVYGDGLGAYHTYISSLTGYMGLGTASATQKLHVSGNARITGAIYDSNNDPGSSNEILKTTVTGTDWVSASTLGDNWGSQTVTTTGATLSGVGTAGSPLQVATDGIGPTELAPTTVTPGSYVTTNITVDAEGRITAAASGSVAYQTLRDNGTDKTQRGNTNFVSTPTVTAALTDDGGNNETEVRMSVPSGGIGATELSSLGTAGTYGSATQVPVITLDADGRASAVTNTTITGTLSGLTATRVPFASSATALADDAKLTWDNTNKRLSVGDTGGSPAASVHIAEGSVASWEPLKAVGTVSGNMITTLSNAQNSGGASNNLVDLSVGGASAGDPAYRLLVNGVNTWVAAGIDNSAGDLLKIGPGTTPSSMSNVGITITADATPLIGINNDAPSHPLHVIGRATATVLQGISGTPTHTFGAGAGTGPSLGSISGCTNGINIQFTLGSTPTVGSNIVSVTFPTAFSSLSFPTYSCGNDRTALENAAGKFVISAASATALTIKHNALTPALTAGDVLFFRFNTSGR